MRIAINNLDDVFKSPKCGIETMELRGYELIEELFCDSSGFGASDELSLTASQLEDKILELVKKHGTIYTTITGLGQFQIYLGVFKHTGKKTTRKIANNTWELLDDNGEVKAIRLHNTNIITYKKRAVILNSGGWRTNTTKARINKYLPDGYGVYQKNFDWILKTPQGEVPFEENLDIYSLQIIK